MKTLDNIKAIAFFDLDGTLLNANSQLDQEVIDALATLKANGVLPMIATGRGHFELDDIMTKSGITGAVAMNGQYIILDGQVIYKEAIPTDTISKLLTQAHACDEALAFYDAHGYWVSHMSPAVEGAYAYTHAPLPPVDKTRYLDHEVNMLLVLTDNPEQVAFYAKQVPELNYFKNSPHSIDVVNRSTNKGTGIGHVLETLGINVPTYGFGDGPNDLHLLGACDHKTAMGNAVPELKAIADFVSTANTDHGIVNAFKHWGLI